MSTAQHPYLFLAIFLAVAVVFPLIPIGLAWLWAQTFSPAKPGPIKNSTYECGLVSQGEVWIRFRPEYYLYAILFLVFDVETIFLLPFAVVFLKLSVGAFLAMMVFLLLLLEGLLWAWQKGVLHWQ